MFREEDWIADVQGDMKAIASYDERQSMVPDMSAEELRSKIENIMKLEGEIAMEKTNGTMTMKEMIAAKMNGQQVSMPAISVGGQTFGVTMPKLKGDYRGFDVAEPTVRNTGFIRGAVKGLAWYENHAENASVPNNIPMEMESVPTVSTAFNRADLSRVTSAAVNATIGLHGVKEGVALRFLPPYENDDKMFAVLEVNLPLVFRGKYVYADGTMVYTTHLYPVYDNRNKDSQVRPFIMGLLKTSQKYLGRIQAVDKNGVGLTYKNASGQDAPSMVSHYADTMYQSVALPYSNVEILAQIYSFTKARVEARLAEITGAGGFSVR